MQLLLLGRVPQELIARPLQLPPGLCLTLWGQRCSRAAFAAVPQRRAAPVLLGIEKNLLMRVRVEQLVTEVVVPRQWLSPAWAVPFLPAVPGGRRARAGAPWVRRVVSGRGQRLVLLPDTKPSRMQREANQSTEKDEPCREGGEFPGSHQEQKAASLLPWPGPEHLPFSRSRGRGRGDILGFVANCRESQGGQKCLVWAGAASSRCAPHRCDVHTFGSRRERVRTVVAIGQCKCGG